MNTNYVKSKVLEIEKKLQMDKNNENTIKKYLSNKKKDEKWPPPKPQGGGGHSGGKTVSN